MRQFINIIEDDFWTALRNDRIIQDRLKPKPYKNYRQLSSNEVAIVDCLSHTAILLHKFPKYEELKWLSMANHICEEYPELANKHNLTINREHEYWREK